MDTDVEQLRRKAKRAEKVLRELTPICANWQNLHRKDLLDTTLSGLVIRDQLQRREVSDEP
jgi:hypothetical protein